MYDDNADAPISSITEFVDELIQPMTTRIAEVFILMIASLIADGLLIASLGAPSLTRHYVVVTLATIAPLIWLWWRIIRSHIHYRNSSQRSS